MKSELVPVNGDPPIPIVKDMTVIGRREYCDARIDHHGVSKRHCVLVRTDGLLVVRDLASTNGTKVNGARVRWAALLPNDKVSLGGYKCRVYLGPDDVPAPSERPRRRRRVPEVPAATLPPASAPREPAPEEDFEVEPVFEEPSSPAVIVLGEEDLVDDDPIPESGTGTAGAISGGSFEVDSDEDLRIPLE
jgi:pSer/pThr/pTyr-binding forkhead associated (FHA) protein